MTFRKEQSDIQIKTWSNRLGNNTEEKGLRYPQSALQVTDKPTLFCFYKKATYILGCINKSLCIT